MTRTLNALVPGYGCKRQMAALIVAALGEHQAYFEPFCNSMAVLLSKEPCRMEVVNDLHGGITNLARIIAHDELSSWLYLKLQKTLFCEGLYNASVSRLKNHTTGSDVVTRAYDYFVASWMGRNGFAGTRRELDMGFCKRFTSNGGDPATRFRNVVERIPDWWKRLRNVTILCMDGFELIERMEDKEGTACYADPPYFDKEGEYVHDFSEEHHTRLASLLTRFTKTRIVMSYYEHPRLAELYPTWHRASVDVGKNLADPTGAKRAPEVLMSNLPILN